MNILTFDIEEWFHILDNSSTKTDVEWSSYESRIHANIDRILEVLEKYQQKATFFCLGWIAEKYPEIIKKIDDRGYDIGTHGRMHQLLYEQTPNEFNEDLEYSINTLENITGKKIRYFRAPGFSIREDNKWVFEILVSNGIEVDCSIFPLKRAHGGFPSFCESSPSIIHFNGIEIMELPLNYVLFYQIPVVFSGGGYFRMFPYKLIRKWTRKSDYVMSYLHPRDFDPNQPIIKELTYFRRFKSYIGLKTAEIKLTSWLTDFDFIDLSTAVDSIDWDKAPRVNL